MTYICAGHEEQNYKFCNPQNLGTYPHFNLASTECSRSQSCEMFFDKGGRGTEYILCGSPATIENSVFGSILHFKECKWFISLNHLFSAGQKRGAHIASYGGLRETTGDNEVLGQRIWDLGVGVWDLHFVSRNLDSGI